ncbi:MAG: hypothetical protein KBF25_01940 [Chitinophagaceae bacterium]|jgi:hypothetical protein|nr:hypothetical protein [Chitinophagaceae bacterium]
MRKFLLLVVSLLSVLFVVQMDASAKKKKKRKRKAKPKTEQVATTADSMRVVRAPGVKNQQEYDSLKAVKNAEKKATLNEKK